MKIFYDCEFIETSSSIGGAILPLSWGGVREDGKELYVVIDDRPAIEKAMAHPWLARNVIPSLPIEFLGIPLGRKWDYDKNHPDYTALVTPAFAASAVARFVTEVPDPQLWAWYGAYDHVMTAQLFGRMVDLPDGFPMFTHDLKQEADRIAQYDERARELPLLVDDGGPEHHALHDAREVAYRFEYLQGLGVPGGHL